MFNFKISYLWILLIFFLSGKMRSVIAPVTSNGIQKELKTAQKISADTSDENCPKKRKIKKRGLAGTVPQIQDITFLKVLIYKTLKPVYTEQLYTSFLYCVSLKRGPPTA